MYGSTSGLFAEIEIAPSPAGLVYRSGFLNECEESEIVRWIDAQPWDCGLARRVQHYGWRYDYRARTVFSEDRIGPLPGPLRELADRMLELGLVSERMDQAIINEYLPGQGIAAHVDCEPCFGEEIAMVSLLDSYPMEFAEINGCAIAPIFDALLPSSTARHGQGGDKSCADAPVLDGVRLPPTPLPLVERSLAGGAVAVVAGSSLIPTSKDGEEVKQKIEVWLEQGSACVISGPVRHVWTHGIAKRRSDLVAGGGRRLRRRRVSVTFRRVVSS